MSLGPLEIILLLLVVALIFGAKKLPELGKGLGLGIKEFKKETREPVPPPHATTPVGDVTVTDVQARPLDPVAPVPVISADARPEAAVSERDHRA